MTLLVLGTRLVAGLPTSCYSKTNKFVGAAALRSRRVIMWLVWLNLILTVYYSLSITIDIELAV